MILFKISKVLESINLKNHLQNKERKIIIIIHKARQVDLRKATNTTQKHLAINIKKGI